MSERALLGARHRTDQLAVAALIVVAIVLGALSALGLAGGAATPTCPDVADARLSANEAAAAIVVLSELQYEESAVQLTQQVS